MTPKLWKSVSKIGDEIVERLLLDVDGEQVQINRYNHNNNDVGVRIRNRIKHMHMDEVQDYIKERLEE